MGVVGAITPWNSPLYLYMWKIAPALACGNTVVLKPSELASVSSALLATYATEAGIPDGVLNIVSGTGEKTGRALAGHRGIDKVSFTGGVPAGRAVASLAAANFTPATIEAGGKAPLIVFGDGDIELGAALAARGAYRSAGQSCAQIARILVAAPIYEQFTEAFLAKVRQLRIGPPLAKDTDIGPLISAQALARCAEYARLAESEGCHVIKPSNFATAQVDGGGYYFEPTVVVEPNPSSRVFTEEIFGPIVTINRFDTDEEALALANGVELGLVAGVVTSSLERSQRFARDLCVGMVCINAFRAGHWLLPYGGRKNSGMGFDNGYEVMNEYTQIKTVELRLPAATF
jgi:aldehyde dehydrogenase (NAD+)